TAKNLLSNSNLAEEEIKKLNIYINKTESFLYIKLDDKELFENNLKKVLKIADSISNEKEKNYYLADLNNELAAKLLSNNNDMINLYDKTEDYKKALSLLKNNEDFYIKADNKKYLLDFISNSLIINNKFDDNIIEIIQKQIERCQDHYLSDSFISNYYLRNLLLQKEAYQNLNNDNKALEYLIKADKQLDKIKVINQFIKELWIEILEEIIQLTEEDFNPDINQSYYIKKIQKIRKIKIDKDVLVDLNILEENTNSEFNLSSSSLKQLEENKQQAIKDNRIDIARQIQDEIDALYKKN
ncbi:MAG: hypothetical protein KA792_07860, partial [Bacteroidales bacterium]|nr:hypothetical protein [Bacteroidales bacterium]